MNRVAGSLQVLLLLAMTACAGDSVESGRQDKVDTPPAVADEASSLPTDVLVGTDIVSLDGLLQGKEEVPVAAGRFVAEQGGAVLEVELQHADGGWKIVRKSCEPGLDPDVQSYEAVASSGNRLWVDGVLEAKTVADGLLLLEYNSGIEEIPSDLWVLYEHVSEFE